MVMQILSSRCVFKFARQTPIPICQRSSADKIANLSSNFLTIKAALLAAQQRAIFRQIFIWIPPHIAASIHVYLLGMQITAQDTAHRLVHQHSLQIIQLACVSINVQKLLTSMDGIKFAISLAQFKRLYFTLKMIPAHVCPSVLTVATQMISLEDVWLIAQKHNTASLME
jgi:hypothetical protein